MVWISDECAEAMGSQGEIQEIRQGRLREVVDHMIDSKSTPQVHPVSGKTRLVRAYGFEAWDRPTIVQALLADPRGLKAVYDEMRAARLGIK